MVIFHSFESFLVNNFCFVVHVTDGSMQLWCYVFAIVNRKGFWKADRVYR